MIHGVDRFTQVCTATFVDTAIIDPDATVAIGRGLETGGLDFAISRFILSLAIDKVREDDLVLAPRVREDGISVGLSLILREEFNGVCLQEAHIETSSRSQD